MKKLLFVFTLMIFVLSACSASPTQAVLPAETSVPPTATLEPLQTLGTLLFRDDFDGSLDKDWQWLREDKNSWNLINNPGWLEIAAGFGSIPNGNISNLLFRPVPTGNFELETKLNFKPTEEQQLAGLIIYESAASHIKFGRGLCNAPHCVGDGLYFERMNSGVLDEENFDTKYTGPDTFYLRLRLEGDVYTAHVSTDGQEWKLIGTHKNGIKPQFVGLVSGQAFSHTASTPAQFDYFVINTLP